MNQDGIRFSNGASYERYMGQWSQHAGNAFLDWLRLPDGLRWLDVGCGNGAFTERLAARCAPAAVLGIDPSEEQLAYARARAMPAGTRFQQGDAMALPCADDAFDVAVMPLVIFFVPDPARGVAEMLRVVRAGGCVAAYAWDMPGGGFPYEILLAEIRRLGLIVPAPPSPEASKAEVMRDLWMQAGLAAVETCEIRVSRSFNDFEDFWTTALGAPSVGQTLANLAPAASAELKARICARLAPDAAGRIVLSARANAVKGCAAGQRP